MRFSVLIFMGIFLATLSFADHKPGHPAPGDGGGSANGTTLGSLSCATDEIARFDGSQWVCDSDRTGGDASWVVLDSDNPPKPVGVMLIPGGAPIVAVPVGDTVARLEVAFESWLRAQNSTYYKDTGCSGQAYVRYHFSASMGPAGPVGFNSFVNESHLLEPPPVADNWLGNSFPAALPLDILGPQEEIDALSTVRSDGTCQSFTVPQPRPAYPVQLSGEPDLYTTFPPPYSLTLQ